MTRLEFLRAVFRSWPIRLSALVLGGLVAAYVVVGLWQAWSFFLFAAVVVGLTILVNALCYVLKDEQGRHRLGEESRRTRSHWAYAYHGLLWSGIGVAMGSLLACWSSGRDPTGGLVAGLALAGFGTIAHLIGANRRAS
jgi:hypothetical protein